MTSRKVSHYEILDRLGAGGMGEIYRARDSRLNRMVAIKALPNADSSDSRRRRRFLQEAQAASALNHPNIVTVHDILIDDGIDLLVMELVTGQTLADLVPESGLPSRDVLKFGLQIASALAAAHAAGIVHRDIKPRNIMVTGSGFIKVLDFGLAKTTFAGLSGESGETVPAPLTIRGTVMGTVSYMSPEQAEGKEVDARSDIFSFGIVLYEMVTGHAAFAGDSALSTLSAILRDEVRPIRELAPDTPPQLIQIVDRCLRKSREQRWQSMEEVRASLEDLRQQYDSRTAPTEVAAPPRRRSKTFRMPVAVVCAAILCGGGWWLATRERAAPEAAPISAVSAPPPAPVTEAGLTNDSIVQMVEAKVEPGLIVEHIRSSKTLFDLSTTELIRLTKAGVPTGVIEVMRDPSRPVPRSSPPARSAAAPVFWIVAVADGLPFPIELADNVPSDARSGTVLQFRASKDVLSAGTVVIAKGAGVTGEVVDENRRTALVIGRKMTYQLLHANAVNGQKLKLRATASRSSGQSRSAVDTGTKKKPKGVAAPAGMEYTAYIDGGQSLAIRK